MKAYSSYKDSTVEWVGEIPSHWDRVKTNFISENLDGKRVPLNSEQRSSMLGEIPYWGSNGIVDYVNQYIFDEELVLVGEDGSPFFDRVKDVSFFVSEKVWVNNHIHILRAKHSVVPRFLTHSFNCVDYKEFISGSTRDKLTQADLSRIPHFIPPIIEQKQIVSFLDSKTQKIDKLRELTEQKIAILKEQRIALINQCVTKGLNANVEMKDSGVEWIGEIPKHWLKSKLKYLTKKIIDNRGRTPAFGDSGIPMLEIANISRGIRNPTKDFKKFVEKNIVKEYERDKVKIGDILISTVGATSGKVVIIEEEPCYFIAQNVVGIRTTDRILSSFMYYSMSSKYFFLSLMEINKGNTIDNLKVSVFINNLSLAPPLHEQQHIVEHLDKQTQQIASTIEKESQRIELLKEYRQALISEVVTGKIDVRDEVIA